MKIGIVGLGLIGGSLARAYKRDSTVTVYGCDADRRITDIAMLFGAVDRELCFENIADCDGLFIALYPDDAAAYLETAAPYIAAHTLVIDCCGTKRRICETGFALAKRYGFTFIGGHPMAGTHNSGFRSSTPELFDGAGMVIVPPVFDDMALLDRVKKLLAPVRFGQISAITAEKHDELIAYTSQLAHVVSNAYIKSPSADDHEGFSAGSYKDLTRVARLNPDMWTDLFMENADNLVNEIDILRDNLEKYRDALAAGDEKRLHALLAEGSRRKEKVDGR